MKWDVATKEGKLYPENRDRLAKFLCESNLGKWTKKYLE